MPNNMEALTAETIAAQAEEFVSQDPAGVYQELSGRYSHTLDRSGKRCEHLHEALRGFVASEDMQKLDTERDQYLTTRRLAGLD